MQDIAIALLIIFTRGVLPNLLSVIVLCALSITA